jgi:acyl-CoA thioester hydrolase
MGLINRTEVRVRYADTDQAKVVYYGRYAEWMEIGRTEWLREAGRPYGQVEAEGLHLPVLEVRIFYRRPARYDMSVEVETRAALPRRTRARFDYVIRDKTTSAILAEGYTTHAFVDDDGKAVRPPKWVGELFG